MLLKNQWVNEEIKKEILKIPWDKWQWRHDTQNLWVATKAVLRWKFVEIQAFLKKEEIPQMNTLTQHLNELGKEQQAKPKVSRKKEIIKNRVEINKIEIEKTIEKK